MPKNYQPLPHWNGNLLCSVDIETSGTDPDKYEILQLAIVPLHFDYTPSPTLKPFVTYIQAQKELDPESTKVHGITEEILALAPTGDQVQDRLDNWLNALDLVFDRRLIMLAHNGAFETRWLQKFLGPKGYERVFNACSRDSQYLATGINDMAVARGMKPPFEKVSVSWLAKHFGIEQPKAHDAYYDALTCAEIYRRLVQYDVLL